MRISPLSRIRYSWISKVVANHQVTWSLLRLLEMLVGLLPHQMINPSCPKAERLLSRIFTHAIYLRLIM
ncbi:unnamed protein product [Protopolystoma xenopodis]|uniref:Uncharacterized protein n=1 Tax=Protopolystoma xenopodis TaxID=117903 RepID=A0A3S5CIZ3_9PLAT|nr:unnamed protein product [Protopolystoma xenopodis]